MAHHKENKTKEAVEENELSDADLMRRLDQLELMEAEEDESSE